MCLLRVSSSHSRNSSRNTYERADTYADIAITYRKVFSKACLNSFRQFHENNETMKASITDFRTIYISYKDNNC